MGTNDSACSTHAENCSEDAPNLLTCLPEKSESLAGEGSEMSTSADEERKAVRAAMALIPLEDRQAYSEAMEQAPQIVDRESDPSAFLRISNYCAEAAAQRLAKHWSIRKQLFGDRAFRSLLDLSDQGVLNETDREFLKTGVIITLLKDSKGRSIVLMDDGRLTISFSKFKSSRPRIGFYLAVMCAAENPMSQSDGMRWLRVLRSTSLDPVEIRRQQEMMNTAMHTKILDFTVVGIPPSGGRKHFREVLLPLAESIKFNHGPGKVILGENLEKLKTDLLEKEFCLDQLPTTLGGTWSYDAFDAWFTASQRSSSVPSPANSDSEGSLAEQECMALSLPKKRRERRQELAVAIPAEAKVVHLVRRKDRRTVDHTYRDFSQIAPDGSYMEEPDDITKMSFVQKIHHMLSWPRRFRQYMWWLPHGRAFKICDLDDLEDSRVLLEYFGIERAAIFVLLLGSHGFKVITSGKDQGAFYHECMLRSLPHLLKYFPAPRDVRMLKPDPKNEPCFYSISRMYPLPCTCSDFS